MKYIIGNWKCNKSEKEVREWFERLAQKYSESYVDIEDLTLAVAPPFVYLPLAKSLIDKLKLPLKLAAQDVSAFEDGAYTGEISAKQLAQFVSYVIVGHSERRRYFVETDEQIAQKVEQLETANILPILCIQDEHTSIPKATKIAAYEPVYAIGTGTTESPQKASQVAKEVGAKANLTAVLYGGSVKPENIELFLQEEGIAGALVGGASLSPDSFWDMIIHASKH